MDLKQSELENSIPKGIKKFLRCISKYIFNQAPPPTLLLQQAPRILCKALVQFTSESDAVAAVRAVLALPGLDPNTLIQANGKGDFPLMFASHLRVVQELLGKKGDLRISGRGDRRNRKWFPNPENLKNQNQNQSQNQNQAELHKLWDDMDELYVKIQRCWASQAIQRFYEMGESEIVTLMLKHGASATQGCIWAVAKGLYDAPGRKDSYLSLYKQLRIALSPGEWRQSGASELRTRQTDNYFLGAFAPHPQYLGTLCRGQMERELGVENLTRTIYEALPTLSSTVRSLIFEYSLPSYVLLQFGSRNYHFPQCHQNLCLLSLRLYAMLHRLAFVAMFLAEYGPCLCSVLVRLPCPRWDVWLCSCATEPKCMRNAHVATLIQYTEVIGSVAFPSDYANLPPGLFSVMRGMKLRPPAYLHYFVRCLRARYLKANPGIERWDNVGGGEDANDCDQILFFLHELETYFMEIRGS